MATEHLNCDYYKLKWALRVKYTPDFSDLIQKNVKYITFFILFACLNDRNVDILG